MTVWPSSATRLWGGLLDTVPENDPAGRQPPRATALALPCSPAATTYLIRNGPAPTAVTVHLNVFSAPALTLPSAQVLTNAVSPPLGAASLASGRPPIFSGLPLTTKTGRLGAASSG